MDFDTAKENIQPLRHGRRADRMETALLSGSESLERERRQYEEAINEYHGADPLSPWYEYICWIEQSYLKSGSESGLNDAISKCLVKFESEARYKQDRRFIKLFIKYIDTQNNPQELYSQLYESGIGTMVADLYIAWSYYYDATNDFKKTEEIFQKGIDAGAQPYDELIQAHQNFSVSMSKRLLYNDDEFKKSFQASIEEKRSALTSLRAHNRKYVGSVRTGFAVMQENPGRIEMSGESSSSQQQQQHSKVLVHVDNEAEIMAEKSQPLSIVRRIVDVTKAKNENFHEPGTWSKIKMKNTGRTVKSKFEIMEDDSNQNLDLSPFVCKNDLFERGVQLPSNFVARNKPQSECNDFPMVIEDEAKLNVIPCYEKFLIYPNRSTEISPEELRGFRWFIKKGKFSAPIVEKYSELLINTFESGARLCPGFIAQNLINEPEVKFHIELDELSRATLQVQISKVFENNIEISMEEVLAKKYESGGIKLLTNEDFDESDMEDADMELTLIGERCHSTYPSSRKSFAPRKSIFRKSMLPKVIIDEFEEHDDFHATEKPKVLATETQQQRVRFEEPRQEMQDDEIVMKENQDEKASFKRKLTTPDKSIEAVKSRLISETPPPNNGFVTEPEEKFFKAPMPLPMPAERKSFRPFELDESCSTQHFNLYVKANSVSTPNTKKSVPRLVPLPNTVVTFNQPQFTLEEDEKINEDNLDNSNQFVAIEPIKQLSTIMEVTETTQTKSSSSGENDTGLLAKTPMSLKIREVENDNAPSMRNVFEVYEYPIEQTETLPFKLMKTPRACALLDDFSIATPMYVPDELPSVQIPYIDEPPSQEEVTLKEEIEQNLVPEDSTLQENSLKIPQFYNDEFSHLEIPATQEFSHIEIPATQEVVACENIEKDQSQFMNNSHASLFTKAQTEAEVIEEKEKDFQFSIYEDTYFAPAAGERISVKEQSQSVNNIVQRQAINNDSNILHMPGKENVPPQQDKPSLVVSQCLVRSISDELLELCSKSPAKSFVNKSEAKVTNASVQQRDDLLQFSGIKSLEGSFKALELNHALPPPMSCFDEDLNTEMFKFPLVVGAGKNSTLLLESFQNVSAKVIENERQNDEAKNQLNISIEVNMEEMAQFNTENDGEKVVFKVPGIPVAKKASELKVAVPYKHNVTPFSIFETAAASNIIEKEGEEEEGNEDDMSTTIYYENYEREVVEAASEESDPQEEWEDERMCSFIEHSQNRYEYTIMQREQDSMKLRHAIEMSGGNPFCANLRTAIMEQVNFENYLEHHVPGCVLLRNIPKLKAFVKLQIEDDEFIVRKLIGKGSYGSIYLVENSEGYWAAKQEKPANLWEYFITAELLDRLKTNNLHHMLPAFMNVTKAIIANNSSVLISKFSKYGSIIDVCNKFRKATGRNLDEYVGMILTSQMLSIIDFLHGCHIIHGDVKPDNFLLMSTVEIGNKVPALQLIDFGSAIDMDAYSKNDQFTYVVTTDNFTCCEMLEKKPWTYQTDLFGIAGTAHVMLFGKYMKVEKKLGRWEITSHYPRYFNKELWKQFFSTLLNIPDSFTLPSLQELKQNLDEEILERGNYVINKVSEFNKALHS